MSLPVRDHTGRKPGAWLCRVLTPYRADSNWMVISLDTGGNQGLFYLQIKTA